MEGTSLKQNVESITNALGGQSSIIVRNFFIGNVNPLDATIIYINGLAKNNQIEDFVLKPLMMQVNEKLVLENICQNLIKKYIFVSNSWIDSDLNNIVTMIKRGKTAILINGAQDVILLDTTGGEYRSISEPVNEPVISGSKEGFVENLEINISILKRKVKDSNMVVENLVIGRRSQTVVALIYIKDIVDMDLVNELRNRISDVDIDILNGAGELTQYIEDYPNTLFPQARGTEKPNVLASNLMEGKIGVAVDGTPLVFMLPCVFTEFFQTTEDYNERTLIGNFGRMIRFIAAFIVITFPSLYLTLIKFNPELIPIKFITPIIQSRIGIALPPFLEILFMELVVEFLREGGLRLPARIGQTISLVGGIIIGDTAVKSRIVSPTTLFIVGITVIATFLIPNYEMALSVRLMRFPMLFLANFLGIMGIGIGWYFILLSLCSTDSFGVPYFDMKLSDFKDLFIRAPLWKMNKRPENVPNNNATRQMDFRAKWGPSRRKKNEESGE